MIDKNALQSFQATSQSLSQRLQAVLPPKTRLAFLNTSGIKGTKPLSIRDYGQDALEVSFSSLQLDPRMKRQLVAVFCDKAGSLGHKFQTLFANTIRDLKPTGGGIGDNSLLENGIRVAFTREYQSKLAEWRSWMVNEVKNLPQVGSATPPGSDPKRVFSDEAVATLDAVFAKKPRVSAAERRKLSQVTGLSNRQIAVWFANRRVRVKPHDNPDPKPRPYNCPRARPSALPRRSTLRTVSNSSTNSTESSSSVISYAESLHDSPLAPLDPATSLVPLPFPFFERLSLSPNPPETHETTRSFDTQSFSDEYSPSPPCSDIFSDATSSLNHTPDPIFHHPSPPSSYTSSYIGSLYDRASGFSQIYTCPATTTLFESTQSPPPSSTLNFQPPLTGDCFVDEPLDENFNPSLLYSYQDPNLGIGLSQDYWANLIQNFDFQSVPTEGTLEIEVPRGVGGAEWKF